MPWFWHFILICPLNGSPLEADIHQRNKSVECANFLGQTS